MSEITPFHFENIFQQTIAALAYDLGISEAEVVELSLRAYEARQVHDSQTLQTGPECEIGLRSSIHEE